MKQCFVKLIFVSEKISTGTSKNKKNNIFSIKFRNSRTDGLLEGPT